MRVGPVGRQGVAPLIMHSQGFKSYFFYLYVCQLGFLDIK